MAKTVLITGASGGIGLDFARIFAKNGYNLILVARSETTLQEQAQGYQNQFGVKATVIVKDLSQPNAAQQVYDSVKAAGLEVNELVNNAGFASYGKFWENDLTKETEMLQVNILALTQLTHLFLPTMVKQGYGRILNVASTAAFQPGPLMAVYYATKAYVLSFSEAIANELEGTGVTVTTLCPGATQSGFQARAAMEDSKLVKGKKIMDSQTVAQMGFDALHKGKTLVITGLQNAVMAQSVRLAPRKVITRIVRNMMESATH